MRRAVLVALVAFLVGCADWLRESDPNTGQLQGRCFGDATCQYPSLACARSFGAGYRCLPKADVGR